MRFFGRSNKEEEKEESSERVVKSKLKDLKPENKKRRKEPPKPWGKKERFFILFSLLITIVVSIVFSLLSGNFELPKFPDFNLDTIFKGETIIVGNKENVAEALRKKKAEEIINLFREKTKDLKGVYAFEVVDIETGFRFGINQKEVMQAASLIKLPLMLYVQGKVDDAKIEAMGKRSDNTVFRELVNKFGKKEVQDYINSLGMLNTSIEENSTTPEEISNFFLSLYKNKEEKILGYLTDTSFEKWIKAGVPEGIRVAHKYGREVGVVNDAGIIYSQKPFILVIMSKEADLVEADREIPKLTEMIYLKKYEETN